MAPNLNLSIAMTTFNGDRFLQEQLDSFINQTRLPDELVVCDDGSRDETLEILEKFGRKAPFSVKIFRNSRNLGYAKNFEKAITLCQGDLVSLSDQDDIWLPNKLREIEQIFLKYPATGYVFSDGFIVDEKLKPLNYSLWDYLGFSFNTKCQFLPCKFYQYTLRREINGAIITINAKLRDALFPLPEYWSHDGWISFAGSLIMDVIAFPTKLIKYRRHLGQQFGAPYKIIEKFNKVKSTKRVDYTKQSIKWENALSHIANKRLDINEDILKHILNKKEHYAIRGNMPRKLSKRINVIAKEIINRRYLLYSDNWKSIAMDLLF